jgi:hypothetical protein
MGIINYITGEFERSAESRPPLSVPERTRLSVLDLFIQNLVLNPQIQATNAERSQKRGAQEAHNFIDSLLQPLHPQTSQTETTVEMNLEANQIADPVVLPVHENEVMMHEARMARDAAFNPVDPADVHGVQKLNA